MKTTSFVTIMSMLSILAMVALMVSPAAGARPGGGSGVESCSVSCTVGGGCSAWGPAPCSCDCTGIFGLGGPRCYCGGMMIDNPPGE